MRIECTQGCGAIIDVAVPPMPDVIVNAPGSVRISEAQAELAAIRAESDRTVGHAITEALLAHYLFDCRTAKAADADCGATSPMGYACNLQTNHDDDHEHQVDEVDDQGNETTRTIARWPNLQVVASE